jgi:arabinofuranosyltransferase
MRSAFACSLLAMWVIFRLARFSPWAVLGATGLALSSRAFLDYSSSGLENPLAHALAAWLVLAVAQRNLTKAGLATGLLWLTRPDLIVLGLPATLHLLWRDSRPAAARFRALIPGASVLIAWCSFAFLYYGFILPNTAYAKQFGPGLPRAFFVRQGFQYLVESAQTDPATLLVVLVGMVAGLARPESRGLATGLLGYMAYVVWVGGDFMSGRFLSTPFLVGVAFLVAPAVRTRARLAGGALAVIVLCTLPQSPLRVPSDFGVEPPPWLRGVHDERASYFQQTALRLYWGEGQVREHEWWRWGDSLRSGSKRSGTMFAIGFFGFAAGPERIVIDQLGLGDPLLARLPVDAHKNWIVGHLERALPAGYEESLDTGKNLIADPALREYYARLSFVTRGPILSARRLGEAFRMNLGAGHNLIDAYADHMRRLEGAPPRPARAPASGE